MDSGHLKIRDHNVDPFLFVFDERLLSVFSEEDLVTGSFQDGALKQPSHFVVIDDVDG